MTALRKDLAEIFGVSERRINQLVAENIIPKAEKGRYQLETCVQNWIDYKLAEATQWNNVEYQIEHAKLEKAKREKAEIELAKLKARMCPAEEVEYFMNDMNAQARAKLRSLPAKVAPMLCGKANANEVQRLLLDEIDDCLIELADYTPGLFRPGCADDDDD